MDGFEGEVFLEAGAVAFEGLAGGAEVGGVGLREWVVVGVWWNGGDFIESQVWLCFWRVDVKGWVDGSWRGAGIL